MDKNFILESAKKLKQVSEKSAEEFSAKSELLIAKINELMIERADLEKFIGEDNIAMMKDNHANHVRFISSMLKMYNPEILTDTVLWVFRAYRSHGFKTNYWATQLNSWILIINQLLTKESFNEIYPIYEWMQINIPIFVKLSDEKLEAPNSLH